MAKIHHPRLGSLQYWPRKRARHSLARIRAWAVSTRAKPVGFIGYKAGMTHVIVQDTRAKSMTKGEFISLPATIIECPSLKVMGIVYYLPHSAHTPGKRQVTILAEKLAPELRRVYPLSKKNISSSSPPPAVFNDVRLLVHTQPSLTGIGTKKPLVHELALGGSAEEKEAYARSVLGKEISVGDVFEKGVSIDIRGISKGKGFQGTVKRFGAHLRQHKAEKVKRGIATLGPWTPKRIRFSVPQPGKMGFHQRTEYNKYVIALGSNGQSVTPAGGLPHYGLLKNPYLLIHGSVIGPQKRAVFFQTGIRPPAIGKEAFTLQESSP